MADDAMFDDFGVDIVTDISSVLNENEDDKTVVVEAEDVVDDDGVGSIVVCSGDIVVVAASVVGAGIVEQMAPVESHVHVPPFCMQFAEFGMSIQLPRPDANSI